MSRYLSTIRNIRFSPLLIVLFFGAGLLFVFSRPVYGDTLPTRSLLLSDNLASHVATYQLSFTIPLAETLGSIELQLCANSPLAGDPCTAPTGFDISSAVLANQSGATGFTILAAGTNANTLVLTRAPLLAAAGPVSYTLNTVTNPSGGGTFYGRVQTFASSDASGANTDFGGLAIDINRTVNITTVVPPYLLFCAGVVITGFNCATTSGAYVNFGNIDSVSTGSAETQMLTATNADFGFTISVAGTTMTSGNNIINAMAAADVSRPGVGQFGLNLVANITPAVGANPQGVGSASPLNGYNQPDFYKFASGDSIASTPTADDFRKFTASYIVNIPHGQPVGVYVATLTYVCLANF